LFRIFLCRWGSLAAGVLATRWLVLDMAYPLFG
jgi:hypothetical protein